MTDTTTPEGYERIEWDVVREGDVLMHDNDNPFPNGRWSLPDTANTAQPFGSEAINAESGNTRTGYEETP